jgi:cellulose biosynthesis protein BcsQ
MPEGAQETEGSGTKWFTIEELNAIRGAWTEKRGVNPLIPKRPANKRALRVAVSNFKGGAGKSTTALHFAHAAALDGYKVLVVDFDPQATISHAMGLVDVAEELTVWGIIARDLMRETKRMNLQRQARGEDREKGLIPYPSSISSAMIEELSHESFITETCWPTIDMIGSCANAAFVEFATAEYRMTNQAWSFFAAVDRYLDRIPDDRYDLVIFDCPPAIGYQSLNAVFAADVLYVPTGPGYWEYDSTTSFMAQLSESLAEMGRGFEASPTIGRKLPKDFLAIKVVLTRYEPNNELHNAMRVGLKRVFGDWVTEHPIELTRAVEQTGRFLQSVYEMDYRRMTRETWRRARRSFDAAYGEFKETALEAWEQLPASERRAAEAEPTG